MSAGDEQPTAVSERFAGRHALVTGGTRGIGRAVAMRLAAEGASVSCFYRSDEASAASLVDAASSFDPGRVQALQADVCDDSGLVSAISECESAFGPIDILVNNAGGPSDGLFLRATPEKVNAALGLNLASAMAASRAVLPAMLKAKRGRIVNMSSVVADMGNAGQTLYASAKAGLEGFTRSLAREVGAKGITVNCVAPGLIETDVTAGMSDAQRAKALEATSLRRFGEPSEVAAATCFLCSDEAAYITGTVLQVNGGMYM